VRYRALAASGVLCGLSGAYLSIAHNASFIRDMSAGKGYLALAALIFGQWRPVPTLGACLLFAFADAVQVRLQGTPLPIVGVVPVQLIQAIPYVLTVCLLAGFVRRGVAARASGGPYVRERAARGGPLGPMRDGARQALANAHPPFSRFRVGACLRATSG